MRSRKIKKILAVALSAAIVFNSQGIYYADEETEPVTEAFTEENVQTETDADDTAESVSEEESEPQENVSEESDTQESVSEEETTTKENISEPQEEVTEETETTAYTAGEQDTDDELSKADDYINISSTEYTVYLGQEKGEYSLYAYTSLSEKIKWSSTNESIVKVDNKGNITPVKAGVAFIKVTAGGLSAKCKVKVKKPELEMYTKEANLYCGSSVFLYVYKNPYESKIKWKSSNTNIAVVDGKGNVLTKNPGVVKIYASAGGAKVSCKVRVYKDKYELDKTAITIVRGKSQTLKLLNVPQYESARFIKDESINNVTISNQTSDQCKITGKKVGKQLVYVQFSTYVNGKEIEWNRACEVNVVEKGITKQQFSMATGTSEQLRLVRVDKSSPVKNVLWKSSSPNVASVNQSTGLVNAKSAGKVKITAVVTLKNGEVNRYTTDIKVSSPSINITQIVTTPGKTKKIQLSGVNKWSKVSYKSSNPSVATVDADGNINTLQKGSTIIRVNADGKTIGCHVYVSNPSLADSNAILAPGWTTTISVKGINKKSSVSFSSDNSIIASVNGKGVVTAGAYGATYITVLADGQRFRYLVEVAPERAINACNKGAWILANWTYSQELRMNDGYYDCSSLVFKSYGYDAGLIGGTGSWAPTAANMAKYMSDTGRVLSYQYISFENMRPGDLIFHGGADNGRYLGIYHVDLYYGGGSYPAHDIVMIARPLNE